MEIPIETEPVGLKIIPADHRIASSAARSYWVIVVESAASASSDCKTCTPISCDKFPPVKDSMLNPNPSIERGRTAIFKCVD